MSDFDIIKASNRLSELDFKIVADNMHLNVLWFRVMAQKGEWEIGRHKHSSYEFHFIAYGQCKVISDHGEFVVKGGEFYLTAPGVYHDQKNAGNEPFFEYCLNCDISLVEEKESEAWHMISILSRTPCVPFKDLNGTIDLFERALGEAYNQSVGFYNIIKGLVVLIIGTAVRTISNSRTLCYEVPMKAKKDDFRLEQIKQFIMDNITDNITTKDISSFMYLSEKQVCRIIRQTTGLSTKEYIIGIKLKTAKELLKETSLSVKEISNRLGFSSEFYFSQFFKSNEGYSPSNYRLNTKNV